MSRVRAALDALTPRARHAAVALVALAVLVAYAFLVNGLDRARSRVKADVTALRAASLRMEQHALDIARLRTAPKPAASNRELRSVIEMEAKAGGVVQALRMDASGSEEVRVIVARVAFPDWLAWLERLQSANVRVQSCRVEMLSAGGIVTATATLMRTP
jgi:type II secretory pathway component PulM